MCTANQCRSPMAERLLEQRLDEAGVGDAEVAVASAGRLPGGAPATPHAVRVLRERGLDLSDHRSRTHTAAMVEASDLVVAMAREHVREVVALHPPAFARTFTLKELVRRARDVAPRRVEDPFEDWLALVGEGRLPRDLLGEDRRADVADPIGRSLGAYRRTADELDDLLGELVALAFPPAGGPPGPR